MALVPYPESFPSEAFTLVLDKVRGKSEASVSELVHAGWNVAGFAFKQALGGGPFAAGEDPEVDMSAWSDEEVLQAVIDKENGAKGGLIPWAVVAKIALKVVMAVLVA